jgi:hypothetical protein
MQEHFTVEATRPNKTNYRFNPSSPLVSPQGHLSRAYTTEELTRIVEISESAANPGKSNANDIPVFMFFQLDPKKQARPPSITIPPGSNKYYCRLQSNPDHPSGNYPDDPSGLANISFLHAQQMIQELKRKNHPLPMTVIYHVGMNNNHTGTVAFRISSFDDPSKNEVMVINTLPGYSRWENAAVQGITAAMQNNATANKEKEPEKIIITPNTVAGIQQATGNMNASCAGLTAATPISAEQSFSKQKDNLINHLKNLTGFTNEAALRRDHQKILAFPHPTSSQFNPGAVGDVLSSCERVRITPNASQAAHPSANVPPPSVTNPAKQEKVVHNNSIQKNTAGPDAFVLEALYTQNEFMISAEKYPELVSYVQERLRLEGKSLFDVCSIVNDPASVIVMFRNKVLIDAINAEGMLDELIQTHMDALTSRQVIPPAPSNQNTKEVSHGKSVTNADDFVREALHNPDLIDEFKNKGGSLFKLCSNISKKEAIKDMFFNEKLMDEIEKEQPGNRQKLIDKHSDIFNRMWPDYNVLKNAQDFQAAPKQQEILKKSHTANGNAPPNAMVLAAKYTPNEFMISAEKNTILVSEVQKLLKFENKSLFDICSSVNNQISVVVMFRNKVLMDAIRKEGRYDDLLKIHMSSLTNTLPPQKIPAPPKQSNNKASHRKSITTANDFVREALHNPDLIDNFKKKGGSLFKLCSNVSKEEAIKDMFFNEKLMVEIEKEQAGNVQKLINKHSDVFYNMWPDYDPVKNTYSFQVRGQQIGRNHEFAVSVNDGGVKNNDAFRKFKNKYNSLTGDHLKTQILDEFKLLIKNVQSIDELNRLKDRLEKTPEYSVLQSAQRSTIKFFSAFGLATTTSVATFNDMFDRQEKVIEQTQLIRPII